MQEKIDPRIKLAARMSYLQTDSSGERKNSYQKICDTIENDHGYKVSVTSVVRWASEENWDKDLLPAETGLSYSGILSNINRQMALSLMANSARHIKYIQLEQEVLDDRIKYKNMSDEERKLLDKKLYNVLDFDLKTLQSGVNSSHKTYLDTINVFRSLVKEQKELAEKTNLLNGSSINVTNDVVWEYEPVDIQTFMLDPDYCNLQGKLYKCVIEDLKEIFYGNPRLFNYKYKEIVFKESIRTGKSERAALLSAYLVYLLLCLKDPASYFSLLPGAKIAIVNVSVNATQAKIVVYGKIKAKIDGCKWFADNGYPYDSKNKLILKFDACDDTKIIQGKIYKNIYVIPGNSSEYSAVGYDVIGGIMDEASIYPKKGDEDQAQVIYDNLKDRIDTTFGGKGMMVMSGNPMHLTDFLEDKIKMVKGNDDAYVIDNRSHWDAVRPDYDGEVFYFNTKKLIIVEDREKLEKDTIAIPIMYKKNFEEKPEISARNLAGLSLAAISRFITDTRSIDRVFVGRPSPIKTIDKAVIEFHDWFKPVTKGWHTIHVDLGVTGDALGFCMGHIYNYKDGKPSFWVDLIFRIQGTKGNPVIFQEVRDIIVGLPSLGFKIKMVTFDGYQSTDSIQILKTKGFDAEVLSVDKPISMYGNLRSIINEKRVNCYYDSVLEVELSQLEDVNGKKVDHPFKGSKDMADALCGMVNSAMQNIPVESIRVDESQKKIVVKSDKNEDHSISNETVVNSMLSDQLGEGV